MWLLLVATSASLSVAAPERGVVDRTQLSIDSEHGTATLTLGFSSRELRIHESSTTIDIPRGTRVIAMAVTIGGARAVAKPMIVASASEAFARVTERKLDPALLELADSTRDNDRLRLRVFPVAKTSSAQIEITLELPELESLELDAPRQATIELDGKSIDGGRVDLPPRTWMSDDPAQRNYVTANTSLFASEPVREPVPTVTIGQPTGCGVGTEHTVDAKQIKMRVKLARARLRRCYVQQAQRDHSLAGTATMHFLIAKEGRPRDIFVDGTLANADVRACIADEITTWTFPTTDIPTQVNYPLEFRLAN